MRQLHPSTHHFSLVLLLALLAACSDGGSSGTEPTPPVPPAPPPPAPQRLTVIADSSVRLAAPLPTGDYPKDTTLTYSVQPAPGYTDLLITVDSVPVPAAGTISMSKPRVLVAVARPAAIPAALPANDPAVSRLAAVLESPRPEFSYQSFLDGVAALSARVTGDSLAKHMRGVEDWLIADDERVASFREVDSLLAGRVFEWRPPVSAQSVLPGPERSAHSIAPPAAEGPRVALIYINGVANSLEDATTSQAQLASLARQRSPALASQRARHLTVYSPSVLLPFLSEHACERRLIADVLRNRDLIVAYLNLPGAVARPWIERRLGCSFRSDPIEALRQIFDETFLRGRLQRAEPPGASLQLRGTISSLHQQGYVAIVVAHSQGNLMTSAALRGLSAPNNGPTLCTSYIGVAAPGTQNPGAAAPVSSVTAVGQLSRDIILIFGPNGSTPQSNTLSTIWDVLIGASLGNVVVRGVAGLHLHSFTGSYLHGLLGTQTRDWIGTRLREHVEALDSACKGRFRVAARDSRSSAAVAGVTVTSRQNGVAPIVTAGDAGGSATTPGLPLRPTVLEVTAPNYDTVWIGGLEPTPHGLKDLGTVVLTRRDAGEGDLRVTAADDATARGIAGATIRIRRNDALVFEGPANSSGVLTRRLRAGTYLVEASATGYRPGGPLQVTVRENATVQLTVPLVNTNTADFTGTWAYSNFCNESLGHVTAELHAVQNGARLTGDIRLLQTRQGGAWFEVEGVVSGRTLTGNSTRWIEANPNFILLRGWRLTQSADGNSIVGAPPISSCPDVPWVRVQSGRSTAPELRSPEAMRAPAATLVPPAGDAPAATGMTSARTP